MRAALRTLTLAGLILGLVASRAAAQHPQIREGFWVSFGLGYGSVTGLGGGVVAGLGYDIRVGRTISITPTADFWYGSVGDLKSNGSLVGSGWKQAIASFGLGVPFH